MNAPKIKRVLLVHSSLRVGGVDRKIAEIARYLTTRASEHSARLVIEQPRSAHGAENVFYDEVQQANLPIDCKPPTRALPFFLYLLWRVFSYKPDILVAFTRRPSIFALTIRALLFWRTLRVVIGNETVASHALQSYIQNPITRALVHAQMQWLYPRATLILTPSDTSRQDLVQQFGVSVEKIRVIKNWTLTEPSPRALSKKFGLIYVGRVGHEKQLTRFVEIISQIQQTLPTLRVVIVGDGNDLENVKRATRAHNLERVIEFVGYQPDVTPYLAASKIFCLTSRFEGLPLAALEAMAFGLPVVTLAYDGAHELVQTEHTGFIVKDGDEMCAALLRLLMDDALRERMGNNAQVFVREAHGVKILQEYVETFLQVD